MKYNEATDLMFIELEKAIEKHKWPTDIIHAAAVVGEESGELTQAANDHIYESGDNIEAMKLEAAQTAAVAIRFLMNLEKTGEYGE